MASCMIILSCCAAEFPNYGALNSYNHDMAIDQTCTDKAYPAMVAVLADISKCSRPEMMQVENIRT